VTVTREWMPIVILSLSLLGASASAAVPGERQELRINPFMKPDLTSEPDVSGADSIEERDPADLELRGTLMAGSDPMANIGGVILEVGEEVDGYRLVSIDEREVVLEKGSVRKTLTMDDGESNTRND